MGTQLKLCQPAVVENAVVLKLSMALVGGVSASAGEACLAVRAPALRVCRFPAKKSFAKNWVWMKMASAWMWTPFQ